MPTWLASTLDALRCLACVGVVISIGYAVVSGSAQWFMASLFLTALYGAQPTRARWPFIVVLRTVGKRMKDQEKAQEERQPAGPDD